ncbi:trace amine-associated receptor 2-like [Patiria miniata]|uniref:G-protein coupled receptors family 1 profile domain-containing protein n=1 Tax=Patiria miniata TaxID=46514 RepID=A0A914AXU2_PATMI|nr:trace amine-associated receptor 2-like [Patiria miniata]
MANVGNGTKDDWKLTLLSPVLAAVYTIIACLAVLGNGMVITVMLLRRRVFSSFTNRLILHQSVIDSLAGVLYFLQRAVINTHEMSVSTEGTLKDQLICRLLLQDFAPLIVSVTSTYNLVMISVERFMATCHPVRHRNTWTKAKLKFAVGIPWCIGFIYSSHFMFVAEAHQGRCRPTDMVRGLKIVQGSVVIGIEYLVPITILIYTYSRIIITLTKKSANPRNAPRNVINKAKKNVLVTMLLIGSLFVVCWTPPIVLYIYEQFSEEGLMLQYSITILLACNAFVNPIIYCFKYEHFRSELRNLVIGRCRRNQVHDRAAAAPRIINEP